MKLFVVLFGLTTTSLEQELLNAVLEAVDLILQQRALVRLQQKNMRTKQRHVNSQHK